jgi:prevent-host-death family protein
MMEISVHELKDKLSKYLRLVREGKPVVITSHKKPVAVLNPVTPAEKLDLQALLATGKARWSGRRPHIDPKRPAASIKGGSIVDTVLEDRE